jgi:hypothetical protein
MPGPVTLRLTWEGNQMTWLGVVARKEDSGCGLCQVVCLWASLLAPRSVPPVSMSCLKGVLAVTEEMGCSRSQLALPTSSRAFTHHA